MKILINAYACSPHMGSEPGMGWNWCISLAKYCELHIITEGEFRNKIEEELPKLSQAKNMFFYYNEVSPEIRKMCWNQGDWRFYKHYRLWQKKTLAIANDILQAHNIDIVHQLNMIGYREPGYLWKIKNIPFVWGPIGGLKQFPESFLKGSGIKNTLKYKLKNKLNLVQLRYDTRVNKAFKRAELLISSIPDSQEKILAFKRRRSELIPETGTFTFRDSTLRNFNAEILDIIWVGKFDFRKQLSLALHSVALAKLKNIRLHVYGAGTGKEENEAHEIVKKLDISSQVIFHGQKENAEVLAAMQSAHLFLFTSVNEDTSTVVLEAISCGLPVLCFNAYGYGYVIDASVGIKVPLTDPATAAVDFAAQLKTLNAERDLLKKMSANCHTKQQEFSWDAKARQVVELYKQLLKKNNLCIGKAF